jgi:hypothetical protein
MPKNGIFIGLENFASYDPNQISIRLYCMEDSKLNIAYLTKNDIEINPDGRWISMHDDMNDIYTPCFDLEVYQK